MERFLMIWLAWKELKPDPSSDQLVARGAPNSALPRIKEYWANIRPDFSGSFLVACGTARPKGQGHAKQFLAQPRRCHEAADYPDKMILPKIEPDDDGHNRFGTPNASLVASTSGEERLPILVSKLLSGFVIFKQSLEPDPR